MALTFLNIQNPPTEDAAYEELLALASGSGMVTTNWSPGSVQSSYLKLAARLYANFAAYASYVGQMYFNDKSEGDALSLLAASHFDNERTEATKARGRMILALEQGEGPHTIAPGEITATDGTWSFSNDDQLILDNSLVGGNVVTGTFSAVDFGAAYNIANDSTLTVQRHWLGVTVTNPKIIGSESWLLSAGTDEEDDERLRVRNALKWSTLGTSGATADRIKLMALSASVDVADCVVDATNPRGAGTVDVYISGDTNTVSVDTLAAVSGTLKTAYFGASNLLEVYAATEVPLLITGLVYHAAGYDTPTVTLNVEEAVKDFIRSVPIGGFDFTPGPTHSVFINDLISAIEGAPGVIVTQITTPSANITLDVYEKLALDASTFTGVQYMKLSK